MDNNEEEFLTCARYGLMLAEQMGDDFIRASLLKLVRAWLAAAKEIEKAARTGESVRELSDWNFVTTWPEVGASPAAETLRVRAA